MEWDWPQYFVAIHYLVCAIASAYMHAKKDDPCSFLINCIAMIWIVYVLHCGGFW